jgi:hypothetical protein
MTGLETELLLSRALVLALLYGFLVLVALLSWRDLGNARRDQAVAPAAAARLIVLEGAGSDRPAGAAFVLEPVTTLGRDIDNLVVLADDTVSGRHAVLNQREGAWWVEDLRSTNGTWLNSTRLVPEVPELLRSGDVLQFGAVRMRIVAPEL